MRHHRYFRFVLIPLLLLVFVVTSAAQDAQNVIVPDLSGLNVPAAAALLNESGLRLGAQTIAAPSDPGLAAGTISAQSVAPGTTAAADSVIDLTVLGSPNTALVYDDNDLTLINLSGGRMDLNAVTFSANSGAARFRAAQWSGGIDAGDCTQIWSVGRGEPKDVEGCGNIRWLTTNDRGMHFWTAVNGVAQFDVLDGGVLRTTCPAAPAGSEPMRCEVYLSGAGGISDSAPFIYFAYTTDRFVVMNPTKDQWMPLGETPVYNFNPGVVVQGAALNLGDATLYNGRDRNADLSRLAPGQCLMLTDGSMRGAEPPSPCRLIGQLRTSPQVAFWVARFEIESGSDGLRRACPAATADKLTICVLPR